MIHWQYSSDIKYNHDIKAWKTSCVDHKDRNDIWPTA